MTKTLHERAAEIAAAPWAYASEDVRAVIADQQAESKRLREELAWYGEQARLCRLVHSGGDAGRHALQADGGKRAAAAMLGEST